MAVMEAAGARLRERGRAQASARLTAALPWLAPLTCVLVTLGLYGRALGFSYFFDDAYDLTRTETVGYWSILVRPLPGYAYYRPGAFLLWKAIHDLSGGYDPVLLHLLPLVAHALAGWLLYLLLRRLTGSPWSLLAAILFLSYPFSFQAVEILGTLMHALVTAEILGVLLLWYDGRARGSPARLALAGLLAAAALWTHEYGAILAPLLLGLEASLWLRERARPTIWLALPLAFEALFLWRWFTADKPTTGNFSHTDILPNLAIWLQNVAYPFSRQVFWVQDRFGGDPLRLVFIFSVVGLLLASAGYLLAGRRWLPPLALGAALLAFAPAALSLTYEYVQNGPRLFYVVAPAVAAFWGLLPALRFGDPRRTRAWQATTLALLGVTLVQSATFIERRTVMLAYGTEMAEGIIRAGAAHDGGRLLVLNAPSWFAFKDQEYPRGHLGVQLEPGYTGLDRLVYAGSGARTAVDSGALNPRINSWHYNFQPHGGDLSYEAIDAKLRAGEPLVAVELERSRMAVREPGSITPAQSAPAGFLADFGGLQLVDAVLARDAAHLTITTHWYAAAPTGDDLRLRTQLVGPDGTIIVEQSGYPLDGLSPPRLWQAGDLIEDRRVIELSGGQSSAALTVRLGLATPDGSLLGAAQPGGQALPDGWLTLGQAPGR